jgi:hypothetical protein
MKAMTEKEIQQRRLRNNLHCNREACKARNANLKEVEKLNLLEALHLAKHSNDIEKLSKLLNHKETAVRIELASNMRLPLEFTANLLKDKDSTVRFWAAQTIKYNR